jgi:hypothetical protein
VTGTRRRRGAFALGAILLVAAAACEDRPRPAPPQLAIHFDHDSVNTPDTLTGTIRADDPDGIDSVWLAVDSTTDGRDGQFQPTFQAIFAFPIKSSHSLGQHVPVVLSARDVTGFTSTLDTFVVIKGP